MSITATELKTNLGKYLQLAESEDILITKNGKVVAMLSNPNAVQPQCGPCRNGKIPSGRDSGRYCTGGNTCGKGG